MFSTTATYTLFCVVLGTNWGDRLCAWFESARPSDNKITQKHTITVTHFATHSPCNCIPLMENRLPYYNSSVVSVSSSWCDAKQYGGREEWWRMNQRTNQRTNQWMNEAIAFLLFFVCWYSMWGLGLFHLCARCLLLGDGGHGITWCVVFSAASLCFVVLMPSLVAYQVGTYGNPVLYWIFVQSGWLLRRRLRWSGTLLNFHKLRVHYSISTNSGWLLRRNLR